MTTERKFTIRYTIIGALFGLCFPVLATLIDILMQDLPFNWASVQFVQSNQALHWIIDSAPLSLAFVASLVGSRRGWITKLPLQLCRG